jgi:hypothetical protein
VLVLWSLLGYLAVPWLVHRIAPRQVAAALDAELELGDVAFDPFLLRLRLFDVRLAGPGNRGAFETTTPLAVDRVELDLSFPSLFRLRPAVALRLDGPRVVVERDAEGRLNWLALPRPREPAEPEDAAPVAGEDPGGLPRARVSLAIADGRVDYVDGSRPGGFRTHLGELAFSLDGLVLPTGEPAPVLLGAAVDGSAPLRVDARVSAAPTLRVELDLEDLPLGLVDRWLADTTPLRGLAGALSARLVLALPEDGPLQLESSSLELRGLSARLADPREPALAVERIALESVAGPLVPLELRVGRLAVDAPVASAVRPPPEPEPASGVPGPDAPELAATPATEAPEAADSTETGAPPRLVLEETRVRGLALSLRDDTLPEAATVTVDEGRIELGALAVLGARDEDPPTPLHLEARLVRSGTLTVDGRLRSAALAGEAALRLEGLDLAAFAPWVDAATRLGLRAGRLDLAADLAGAAGEPPEATAGGTLSVTGLDLTDPDQVPLLAFERLALEGIAFDLGARRLALADVRLDAPELRFARLADGSTNLSGVGPRAPGAEPPAAPEAPTAPDGAEGAAGEPWRWAVDAVEVTGGTLDFVDEALVIPFATTVETLGGSARGLASDAAEPAELELAGTIPPNGTAGIRARLDPLAPLEQAEIAVDFARVPMPRLSPYVATFAGREVTGGRLELDLDYTLDGGRLEAENRIVLSAFRLGPSVDAPGALDLPLDLALALLRDPDDRIRLEVPVGGDVNDPEFDLGPVILGAVRRVLTNLVTAPFRLLAGLVGGGGDVPIDRVRFPFGAATIPEDQFDRLVALESALLQRPALALVLTPTHAGTADAGALRERALEEALAAELEAVDGDRSAALRALYRRRVSAEELEALEDQYGEDGREGVLEAELRGRLLAEQALPPGALEALARERIAALRAHLEGAGLPPERIRTADTVREVEGGDERLTLAFELAPEEEG